MFADNRGGVMTGFDPSRVPCNHTEPFAGSLSANPVSEDDPQPHRGSEWQANKGSFRWVRTKRFRMRRSVYLCLTVEKALDRARRTVNVLVKAQDTSPSVRISDLGKAIAALRELEVARVLSDLNRQHAELVETRDNALKLRRENLARSAK